MTAEQAGPLHAGRSGDVTSAGVAGYERIDFQVPDETAALIREAVPANTFLAYRSRWRSFEAWCRDAGRVALPATAQTVAAYLTYLAVDRGLKATTADAHLTAIRAVHRGAGAEPADGLAARKVVVAAAKREAARDGRYGPRKAVPVMAADLPAIIAACDPETTAGLRDRAVILLGFALLARRAELAALSISDIEHVHGEGLAVTIRASKTDQSARGVIRRIHYASAEAVCPVRAVLAWLEYLAAHAITTGPLFTRIDRWGNLGPAAGGRYETAGGARRPAGSRRSRARPATWRPSRGRSLRARRGPPAARAAAGGRPGRAAPPAGGRGHRRGGVRGRWPGRAGHAGRSGSASVAAGSITGDAVGKTAPPLQRPQPAARRRDLDAEGRRPAAERQSARPLGRRLARLCRLRRGGDRLRRRQPDQEPAVTGGPR